MKVLIVGKGGREHAIAWKSAQSHLVSKVFIAPGNVGMKEGTLVAINDDDIEGLANFTEKEKIDLTIVGPETSLALGIVDEFEKRGLKIFGPSKLAAQIESSKDFAKKIMKKYKIPTADSETFDNKENAVNYIKTKSVLPIVVKEDGLKAGKGVTVAFTQNEALEALESIFSIPNKVVIEEYLEGFEFSLIAVVNGDTVVPLEVAQDHKRVYDGDKGPNTGGMGVYSPVNKIDNSIVEDTLNKIIKPALKGMESEGIPFKGFLFAGVMLTDEGVKTIEFNARLGDPEAEGILPRMKTDFIELILNVLDNKSIPLEWDSRYTVAVVMASENYPESSTIGAKINIPSNIDATVFHMGTKMTDGVLQTNGGRVLAVVSYGETIDEAKRKAYENVGKIACEKLFFRTDIASKGGMINE